MKSTKTPESVWIKDAEGEVIVDLYKGEWSFYVDPDEPLTLDHGLAESNPVYLYQMLGQVGDADKLMAVISKESAEFKTLIDGFFNEKLELSKRLILLGASSSGAVDSFGDRLTLRGDPKAGFVVESMVAAGVCLDDCSYFEVPNRNALGEWKAGEFRDVFSGQDLYEAVVSLTSDEEYC